VSACSLGAISMCIVVNKQTNKQTNVSNFVRTFLCAHSQSKLSCRRSAILTRKLIEHVSGREQCCVSESNGLWTVRDRDFHIAVPLTTRLRWPHLSVLRPSDRLCDVGQRLPWLAHTCDHAPTRHLRSSPQYLLNEPAVRAEINCYKRAFSHAASSVWNDLPADIRRSESFGRFRTAMRMHELLSACLRKLVTWLLDPLPRLDRWTSTQEASTDTFKFMNEKNAFLQGREGSAYAYVMRVLLYLKWSATDIN